MGQPGVTVRKQIAILTATQTGYPLPVAAKLTQKTVDAALYEGRSHMSKAGRKRWSPHILKDAELPGFGLRITSTNRKSFFISFRSGGRKRTRTVGRADRMSLEEARAKAAEMLASLADEPPPGTSRGPRLEGVETVAQLADAYLEGHLKPNVPSWYADQRLMRTHIKPAMGRSRIADVTANDLVSLRSRIGRRFPADAPRFRKLVTGMFDWAADQGLWPRGVRNGVSAELPLPDLSSEPPAAAPEPAVEPPSTEELVEALERSEERRRELEERLEEVSSSGAEMLLQLNEKAASQSELTAELARAQRELGRARAIADDLPDPEASEKQIANLRQSVEQLLASVNEAERDRQEIADKLADTEARAAGQSRRLVEATRARNELEEKMREVQRRAAIRKVQGRPAPTRRQTVAWLALGAVGGAVLVLLLQAFAGGRQASAPPVDRQVTMPAMADPGPEASETAAASDPSSDPGEAASAPPHSAPPVEAERVAAGPDLAAVEEAIRSWAVAWSEQRVDDYLEAYSAEFVPPDGQGRSAWASQRRNRIRRPASIRVTLSDLRQTVIAADRVQVSFEQRYETPTYADRVAKTLDMVRQDGGWKIASERAE